MNKFNPSLLSTELTVEAKAIIRRLLDGHFVISDFTKNERIYNEFIDRLMTYMEYGFEHKKFRDCPVKFKFYNNDEENMKWLPFRHFIINVISWYPIVMVDKTELNDDIVISSAEMKKMGSGFMKKYIDKFFVTRYKGIVDNPTMNSLLCDWVHHLGQISARFNIYMGLSLNLETFFDLSDRIPGFEELLNFRLDEDQQLSEMESQMKKASSKQINMILNDDKFNLLKPLLQPGSGTNHKQFANLALVGGLKPNCNNKTIKKPINYNYLTGAINSVTDYFINSNPGRNASITNHEFMGKSGHLMNLAQLCVADVKLANVNDCHSPNPISVTIKSHEHLSKLVGRYYYHNGSNKLSKISFDDTDLIGTTVLLRSPTTCSCKHGVCDICYGELSFVNKTLNSAGILGAIKVLNPVTQGVLSNKHHQATNSNIIEMTPEDEFNKYFMVSSSDIVINPSYNDRYNVKVVIHKSDISSSDDDTLDILEKMFSQSTKKKSKTKVVVDTSDSSGDSIMPYYVNKFHVQLYDKSELVSDTEIYDKSGADLFIHESMIRRMTPVEEDGVKKLVISLEDINSDEFIFVVDVVNNGATKGLKLIRDLVQNKDHLGATSIDEIVQLMLDLLIESDIGATSVQGEMVLYPLIRKKSDLLSRPDFNRVILMKDYEILTIEKSLHYNTSITTSLSATQLKKQLVEMVDTYNKVSKSVIDPMFKMRLSEEN